MSAHGHDIDEHGTPLEAERDTRAMRIAYELFRFVYGTRAEREALGNGSHILMALYELGLQTNTSGVMERARAATIAAPAQTSSPAESIPAPADALVSDVAPRSVSGVSPRDPKTRGES